MGKLIDALNAAGVNDWPLMLSMTGKKEFMNPVSELRNAVRSGDENATIVATQKALDEIARYLPTEDKGLRTRADTAIPLMADLQIRNAVSDAGMEGQIAFPEYGKVRKPAGTQPGSISIEGEQQRGGQINQK